jgi:hypothetical protein
MHQISNFNSQILNSKFQISNPKFNRSCPLEIRMLNLEFVIWNLELEIGHGSIHRRNTISTPLFSMGTFSVWASWPPICHTNCRPNCNFTLLP